MLQSDSLFIRTRTKRRLSRYSSYKKYVVFTICLVFILVFLIGIFPHILSSTRRILEGPKLVFSFITNVGPQLEQERGRTNILLLGKGGGTHPGASLTDSIIFMSVNNSTGDTVMISLPRDIWVEELERPEDNKLNRMYEIGEGMKKGGGLLLSKAIVSHLIGQPIHYAVLIDFEGFKKAIDILGGIDIEVERSFMDSLYPIPGKEEAPYEERFEIIQFEKGLQHMDGTTALKFIRSRHAEGEEGTDYARSKRQQKVLLAVKKKVLSMETLLDLGKIKELTEAFGNSIESDIDVSLLPAVKTIALKTQTDTIRTMPLDEGDKTSEGLLLNPPLLDIYNYKWVLVPRSGNWKEIQTEVEETLYDSSVDPR